MHRQCSIYERHSLYFSDGDQEENNQTKTERNRKPIYSYERKKKTEGGKQGDLKRMKKREKPRH